MSKYSGVIGGWLSVLLYAFWFSLLFGAVTGVFWVFDAPFMTWKVVFGPALSVVTAFVLTVFILLVANRKLVGIMGLVGGG